MSREAFIKKAFISFLLKYSDRRFSLREMSKCPIVAYLKDRYAMPKYSFGEYTYQVNNSFMKEYPVWLKYLIMRLASYGKSTITGYECYLILVPVKRKSNAKNRKI